MALRELLLKTLFFLLFPKPEKNCRTWLVSKFAFGNLGEVSAYSAYHRVRAVRWQGFSHPLACMSNWPPPQILLHFYRQFFKSFCMNKYFTQNFFIELVPIIKNRPLVPYHRPLVIALWDHTTNIKRTYKHVGMKNSMEF